MQDDKDTDDGDREQTFVSSGGAGGDAPGESSSLVGTKVGGKYEVLNVLGRGGMGKVYSGRHIEIGRKVAIKVLNRDFGKHESVYLRFKQEAKLAATLSHSNICSVYDFGELADGTPYLVMDLLEGKTLADIRAEQKRIPWQRAVNICSQLCDGLSHAHSKHVLHRDLKPSNIVIQHEGAIEHAKIVDFGIAKSLQEDAPALTATHESIGTPYYMSPEQCKSKKVDHRSDIYSLGCLMYEILTGRPPFAGDTLQVMFAHVSTDPEPFNTDWPESDIPAHLESAILKAMRKSPDERYQTADEMKRDILSSAGGKTNAIVEPPAQLAKEESSGKQAILFSVEQVKLPSVEQEKLPSVERKEKSTKMLIPAVVAIFAIGLTALGFANRDSIELIMDGRRPGEIYNADDQRPLRWSLPVMTFPGVHAIYLGQAHDTPRSKDNDLSIMGHAKVRVTNRTPKVILALVSHAQVEWNIVADPGVGIEKVILISTYGRSQAKGVPENRIVWVKPEETISFYLFDEKSALAEEGAFEKLNKAVDAETRDLVSIRDRPINTFQYAQQLKEFEIEPSTLPNSLRKKLP